MAVGRFVAYYRVSTDKQGKSGLGLEAQREAVRRYLNGGSWSLADEVTEVESGKRNDRPGRLACAACTAPPWWSPSSIGWRAMSPSSRS
jgi:hypothetical protein